MIDSQDMQLSKLDDWLTNAASKGAIAIVAHKNGDMDTIGSAISLAASRPEAMACGVHICKLARRLLEKLDAPFLHLDAQSPRWPKKLAGIVVVDSAAEDQTGLELPRDVPRCIIDHHSTSDWSLEEGDIQLLWPVSATTQIIHQYLLKHKKNVLTSKVRRLLLAGLVADTGRFRHADASSFESASQILDDGIIDYADFIEEFEEDILTRSDNGAISKALSRSDGIDAGPWWLLKSSAGTQESVVCRALMSAGADVAICMRRREGISRLTARASRGAVLAGVHVGNILSTLARTHGGEGGGHDGAAGWSCSLDLMAVESAFIHALAGVEKK